MSTLASRLSTDILKISFTCFLRHLPHSVDGYLWTFYETDWKSSAKFEPALSDRMVDTHVLARTLPIHGFEESLLLIKSLNVRLTEFTESIMLFQLGFGNILLSAKSTDRSRVGNPDDPQHDPRPKD